MRCGASRGVAQLCADRASASKCSPYCLASEEEYLANTIYLDEDVPAEGTRRHAHRLRETLGVVLVLSERLARQIGSGQMVTFPERPDGTGEASFAVNLSDLDVLE